MYLNDLLRRILSCPSRALWLLPTVLALVCLSGCENKQKIQRGVLAGFILDTAGNRVVGATVTSHRSTASAISGEDGRYSFTSLDEGSHNLAVLREGFKPASRTCFISFGNVDTGVDFRLEPLPARITWNIFARDTNSLTIDVLCVETMSCVARYQGDYLPMIQTQPTDAGTEHRFLLSPLRPDTSYQITIVGTTPDGRIFSSATRVERVVPSLDVPGAPPTPTQVTVEQTRDGPKLSWSYQGADPLRGFRIFRATDSADLSLWLDEDIIFAAQNFVIDDLAKPGERLRFALQAVDLDGNVSSLTEQVVIYPGGELVNNVVWKQAWSPIDLDGDIIIGERYSLDIEPGVVVRVSANDRFHGGYDPNLVEILVYGRLLASGTAVAPIRFLSAAALPTNADWAGIRLLTPRTGEGAYLSHLEVMNAARGLQWTDAAATLAGPFTARGCNIGLSLEQASATMLSYLRLHECETGLYVVDSDNCTLDDIVITNAVTGVSARANRNNTLTRLVVRGARDVALALEDQSRPCVHGAILEAERLGLWIRANDADLQFLTIIAPAGILIDNTEQPLLRDNIIVNRQQPGTGIGIEEKTQNRSYPFNNIFGYQLFTKNCNQQGAPIFNLDPKFVGGPDAEYDYHLRADSPLLDVAENGGEPGAYGYPGWR